MLDEDDLEACWADVRGPTRRTLKQALVERVLATKPEVGVVEVTLKEFLLLLENYRALIEKIPAPGEQILFMGVRLKFKNTTRDSE